MTGDPPDEEVVWEIWDKIPNDLVLWPYGGEVAGHAVSRTYEWWRVLLNHTAADVPYCTTCGDLPCYLARFHEAVAVSVIRELLKQGLIVGDFRDGPASGAGPSGLPDVQEGLPLGVGRGRLVAHLRGLVHRRPCVPVLQALFPRLLAHGQGA